MAKLKGEKSDDNMIYIEDDDFWLVVWLVVWLVGWLVNFFGCSLERATTNRPTFPDNDKEGETRK